jgi:hypothetical protein
MPVMVRTLSVSQFCDLLAIDPAYFNSVALVWSHIGFNAQGNKTYRREIAIYTEPQHADTRNESAALSGQGNQEGRQEEVNGR